MAHNCYDILGVARDATVEEIKKAFKKAALTHHPDKGGDPEKFKECSAAVETLTDDRKRSAYDMALIRARSKDGLGGNRDASGERARAASGSRAPQAQERAASTSRPSAAPAASNTSTASSRPPRPPAGAVEIPSDPSSLSIKELKELLSALGIDHEGCLEKADLLALLKDRKDKRNSSTPAAAAGAARGPAPSTPRAATPTGPSPAAPPPGTRALRLKVISLGSGAVGKSTLIKRYCEGRFVQKYIPTIGIDYGVKPVKVLGYDLKVNFFDASGGEEFKDIRTEFYGMGQTSGVLMVFDVTNRKSFQDLESWLDEANRMGCPISKLQKPGGFTSPPAVALCANKVDMPKRVISRADGQEFADKHGMRYFETSASSGEFVVEAMQYLFEQAVNHHVELGKKIAMASG